MKRKTLEMIRQDDYLGFSQYLLNGGDVNLEIYGKSLIEHALLFKSDLCLYSICLNGPDLKKLREREDWPALIEEHDPWYFRMIQEISAAGTQKHQKRIQNVLDNVTSRVMGPKTISYRNVLSFHTRNHAYFTMLACGIHWFEFMHWDYLTKHLKLQFQCEDPEKIKKKGRLAMLVTVCDLDQVGEEILGLSLRINGFLMMREFPAEDLHKELKKAREKKETIIGVRVADNPFLVISGGDVDVDIAESSYFEQSLTFRNYPTWDHQLNEWVQEFKLSNGVYPNIMLASSATYARIEMVANTNGKNHIRSSEGAKPAEFTSMTAFQSANYLLEFCMDGALQMDQIKLIHDHGGGGGKEDADWDHGCLAA